MKKMILVCAFGMLASAAFAQVKSYKSASIPSGNAVAYSLPQTVVKATVVVEKETTIKGPYARFAQKYLGVMAPLADKESYEIVDAWLDYATEADPQEVYVLDNPDKSATKIYDITPEGLLAAPLEGSAMSDDKSRGRSRVRSEGSRPVSYVVNDTAFIRVPIDKKSVADRTQEAMAEDAAQTIYRLRQRRMELVTGEFGEHVFGGGFEAALEELNRLEQEYTALFLGKQYRQRVVKTFDVVPEASKNTAIACRFSETGGLFPATELSAEPIVVHFAPEGKTDNSPWTRRTGKDSRGTVFFRIADMVDCTLLYGNESLAYARMPVYQFGIVVEMPASALK